MTLWVNGRLVADDEPVLPANDHGLVVGDGVFETLKVVDGQPFALSRHLQRMHTSAAGLGLHFDTEAVRGAVKEALAAETRPGLLRLRITLTGGPGPYASDRGDAGATLIVAISDQKPPPASSAVVTVPWSRNERSAVAGLKTISYAENVVALDHAHRQGATEAIFANTRGELCEGTGSNVFLGIDGQLVTPPLSSGCLAGITRSLLLEWRDDIGGIDERSLSIDALRTADEAFLASSIRDVHPIHAIDLRELPAPGPLTERAMAVFARHVAETLDP